MREPIVADPGALASAANTLRAVRLFDGQTAITVTEVSRALGVGKSTAHRVLSTLVAEGFAQRDPVHRRYHAGPVLVNAGLSAMGDLDVRRRARVPMRKLAARTGETVKMLVLQGQFARCIEVEESEANLRVTGRVGELLPANATAGGKLLLSRESEEQLRERFSDGLPAVTPRTITDWNALLVELQVIRDRGWATNNEESEVGVLGVAVAVPGLANRTLAALAVSAPSARMPRDRQVETVRHLRTAVTMIANAANELGPRSPQR